MSELFQYSCFISIKGTKIFLNEAEIHVVVKDADFLLPETLPATVLLP